MTNFPTLYRINYCFHRNPQQPFSVTHNSSIIPCHYFSIIVPRGAFHSDLHPFTPFSASTPYPPYPLTTALYRQIPSPVYLSLSCTQFLPRTRLVTVSRFSNWTMPQPVRQSARSFVLERYYYSSAHSWLCDPTYLLAYLSAHLLTWLTCSIYLTAIWMCMTPTLALALLQLCYSLNLLLLYLFPLLQHHPLATFCYFNQRGLLFPSRTHWGGRTVIWLVCKPRT